MARQPESNPENSINRIVEGTSISGEIKSSSNFRIDGRIEGDVIIEGRLIIGPTGIVSGDVHCQNAEIEGKVEGSISVKELLSLKETAQISGEINTNKLSIQPGAIFTGNCSMGAVIKEMNNDQKTGAKIATA